LKQVQQGRDGHAALMASTRVALVVLLALVLSSGFSQGDAGAVRCLKLFHNLRVASGGVFAARLTDMHTAAFSGHCPFAKPKRVQACLQTGKTAGHAVLPGGTYICSVSQQTAFKPDSRSIGPRTTSCLSQSSRKDKLACRAICCTVAPVHAIGPTRLEAGSTLPRCRRCFCRAVLTAMAACAGGRRARPASADAGAGALVVSLHADQLPVHAGQAGGRHDLLRAQVLRGAVLGLLLVQREQHHQPGAQVPQPVMRRRLARRHCIPRLTDSRLV